MEYDFQKLCLPCYDELIAYAYKRTKSLAEAEDIVQDAMVRALKAWSRWEPQGDPQVWARAWMYRIVSGTFINQYHRIKNFARIVGTHSAREVANELHQDEESLQPVDKIDTLGDEVREALERIRPEWAAVVKLVYIDGHTAPEAAEILGIPPGTVRSRTARGRLALARILAPYSRQRFGLSVKSEGEEVNHVPEYIKGADYDDEEIEDFETDSIFVDDFSGGPDEASDSFETAEII